MSFSDLANAQAERYPEAKVEQVFETLRTELAASPTNPTALKSEAATGIVFGYNEFQAIRAIINGQQAPSLVTDILQIPKPERSNILTPALDAAASDAVAEAIKMHGATDTLRRALNNIQAAYDIMSALLS